MNRFITNTIRFVLDECIPPIIRDNKYFMYPLFVFWFKGKNIKLAMDFKSIAENLKKDDFEKIYSEMETYAKNRKTDLNKKSIKVMHKYIHDANTILDVGCGNGYWLNTIINPNLKKIGCDITNRLIFDGIDYIKGEVENLPFDDDSIDIVTCHHTLEHIPLLEKAISELKRVAKKQVIIVVPKQRYFYYTLDYHLHFFHYKEKLIEAVKIKNYQCISVQGDWVFIGNFNL